MRQTLFGYYALLQAFLLLSCSPVSPDDVRKDAGSSSMAMVEYLSGMPITTLSNGKSIPLIGMGVGNTQQFLVPLLVAGGIQEDKKVRLFDTSHASDNERLISEGISQGIERIERTDEKITVHVVTKVWYTYLGYERTKISVRNSFENLRAEIDDNRVDLKIHVLINWPRCYDYVPWMDCEGEEDNLPDDIKNAGPPPHMMKKNSWKKSWTALEEMYKSQELPIESIGVSNFHMKDMEHFEEFATVQPHILQINLWSLLYDPTLVDYCQQRGIHVMVYSVFSMIMNDLEKVPHAYHHLQKITGDLSEDLQDELTPAQVILAWLMQHGVSVIPKTTRLSRLEENSALSMANVPEMSDIQAETLAHAVQAYLSGEDLEADLNVLIEFKAESRDLILYWKRPDGTEVHVAYIPQGHSFNETTYPKHNYRLYDAQNKEAFVDYKVQAKFGEQASIPF